jgi:hypothetical protein
MKNPFLGAALLLALGAASSSAGAQGNTDAALAETLYRQGRDLMAQGKAAEACPKFAESQRLDPATGTLLNLAACYESVGKRASAWLAYTEAAVAARRDQREDRVRFAQDRISALEPKLSRLTVVVSPEAETTGLEVRLNGALIGLASRGVATPVDPGDYRIEAHAPGKKPWQQQITVGKNSDSKTVTVPPLAAEPVRPGHGEKEGSGGTGLPSRDAFVTERPLTTPIYIAGGATIAVAAASAVTGIVFLKRRSDFNHANEDPTTSESERHSLHDRANSMSIVSSALAAAAVVGAGITAGFYFTRPEERHTATLTPFIAPRAGGLIFSGSL